MALGGNINFDEGLGTDKNPSLESLKDKLNNTKESLSPGGTPWPQTQPNPEFSRSKGFLPPVLISPSLELDQDDSSKKIKNGSYVYEDWLGQKINSEGLTPLKTKNKFAESKDINKQDNYSTRDHYLLFNDNSTDYFRHGLQIIDNLNTVGGDSSKQETPYENNDPVMFGFDIVIDDISSPLLNGSVIDFINNYSNISEIESKADVYEDFKNQFIKFFKTKTNFVKDNIDTTKLNISRTENPNSSAGKNRSIYQNGSNAYMNYYIQNISGLNNLIERNKPGSFNSMTNYRNDVISLNMMEDVSLSLATLANLYKLLYWSKPNGKSLIPENLLRFNCQIIVSECRNFTRVRKAVANNNIQVLKDNLSRTVYTLNECQLFFDQTTHGDSINMGGIKTADNTEVTFDYKFATSKFERFVPNLEGFGTYVGYDNGAMWKIGAPGSDRDGKESVPKFSTNGENEFNENGVDKERVLNSINSLEDSTDDFGQNNDVDLETLSKSSDISNKNYLEKLKNRTIATAKGELQTAINIRANLLSRTINKALVSLQGGGITPPDNVYTSSAPGSVGNLSSRVFYDLRGDLVGFLGNSLSDGINGVTNPNG